MVTEEALAERKAALQGDPGTDSAVKISMPPDIPLHSAQHPTAAKQPEDALDSKVMPVLSVALAWIITSPFQRHAD